VADNIPKLEDNRFEALYQKWKAAPAKKWKIGGSLLAAFLLLEIISLGFTFTWYHLREVNAYPFLDKFALTRTFVSPFLFDNPARAPKGIDYIGPRERRRSEPKWFVSDAMFGWRPAPNVSILKQPHGIKDPVGWKMTNTQGFPAAGSTEYFYEKPKPRGTFRIVVLGGSNVEGDGAESPLDNLPSSLFFALNDAKAAILPHGFERVEVINAGVGAFTSSQEYLYLLSDLTPYEPDLVISYSGAVDFIVGRINYDQSGIIDSGFDYRKRAANSARLDQSYQFWGSLLLFGENTINQIQMIIDEFAIVYVLSKGWEKFSLILSPEARLGESESETATEENDNAYIDAALKAYHQNLRLMAAAAEIYDFAIAFVLNPIMPISGKARTPIEEDIYAGLSQRELASREKYYDRARSLFRRLVTEFSDRKEVCLFDISRAFENVTERVFEDSTHVLGAGNRILAQHMKSGLAGCGLIRRAGAER